MLKFEESTPTSTHCKAIISYYTKDGILYYAEVNTLYYAGRHLVS